MSDEDFLNLFTALAVGGPIEQLGRTSVDGLIVSTINSCDMGYETAILDEAGAHPVERYESAEEALSGHDRWVKAASGLTTITKLGYGELENESEVTLSRFGGVIP